MWILALAHSKQGVSFLDHLSGPTNPAALRFSLGKLSATFYQEDSMVNMPGDEVLIQPDTILLLKPFCDFRAGF
jgi:hypothetical protein